MLATHRMCSVAMCEKCLEIDKKIERYTVLSEGITDEKMIEHIRSLIEPLRAQKTALHPGAPSID